MDMQNIYTIYIYIYLHMCDIGILRSRYVSSLAYSQRVNIPWAWALRNQTNSLMIALPACLPLPCVSVCIPFSYLP